MSPRGQGAPTPPRQIRVDDHTWKTAEVVTTEAGTDRATIIREFLKWYIREPGARLPERPRRQVNQ